MDKNLVIFLNSLILIALMVGIPSIILGFTSLFKVKLNKIVKVFLYAFATGIVLILGSVGFIGEAIETLNQHYEAKEDHSAIPTLVKMGVVVGGAILGCILLVSIRLLSLRKNSELHKHHEFHDHNDHITNYSDIDNKHANKTIAIILLMSHRIIDGLSLGFMASTTSETPQIAQFESWGMIITFIIHLIPMSIVIYFVQLDINGNRAKSLGYSVLMLVITVPFVFAGAYTAEYLNEEPTFWIMPFLFSVSGIIMVILAIIELLPEFIDNKGMTTKQWYLSLLCLIAGLVLGILLLCIHSHSHGHEHNDNTTTEALLTNIRSIINI
ncbi:MAG: ZIP family metal transporter [Ureaplasma sp.]|nr:ZIP family metal transporter [Ureaplasma sp.]